jgi:hypothetical protein
MSSHETVPSYHLSHGINNNIQKNPLALLTLKSSPTNVNGELGQMLCMYYNKQLQVETPGNFKIGLWTMKNTSNAGTSFFIYQLNNYITVNYPMNGWYIPHNLLKLEMSLSLLPALLLHYLVFLHHYAGALFSLPILLFYWKASMSNDNTQKMKSYRETSLKPLNALNHFVPPFLIPNGP